MKTLYVDGGGTATVPTYFSYLCPDTQQRFWANKSYVEYNPVRMNRFRLSNLAPELLPMGCSVVREDGNSSNSIAEYCSLFYGLQRFIEVLGHEKVLVMQDSELIVNQVNTRVDLFSAKSFYECKAPHLIPWLDAVASIWHDGINLKWVSRETIVSVLGH